MGGSKPTIGCKATIGYKATIGCGLPARFLLVALGHSPRLYQAATRLRAQLIHCVRPGRPG